MQTSIADQAIQTTRIMIKALIIAALILLLMIPAYFVKELVLEREATQKAATAQVSNSWAGQQNLTGPILVIPYKQTGESVNGLATVIERKAYLLPDSVRIDGEVKPTQKHRGIFQVMLYSSTLKLTGRFNPLSLDALKIDSQAIDWSRAYVTLGVSDLKGVEDEMVLQWNGQPLHMEAMSGGDDPIKTGFTAPVALAAGEQIQFSSEIRLNGSENLLFTPVGKETIVRLASPWPDPSFIGSESPVSQVSDSGFKATWKSLSHNRAYPQAWTIAQYRLDGSTFGASLFIPVNGYQKTLRSVKYALLCIILTFAAFFIIETSSKRSIHPLQYALVGLALILFYTLLLSFSEYIGFDAAYGLASLATVSLIAWFVRGLLRSGKLSAVIAVVLVLIYSYVFCILQLEDYALLLGSLGLFLTLAVIMHFSRNLNMQSPRQPKPIPPSATPTT